MTKEERAVHLAHHQTAAEGHTQVATCMKSMADFHRKMGEHAELSDRTAAEMHKVACAHCSKMAEHHASLAESHLQTHKALGDLKTDEIATGSSDDVKTLATSVADLTKMLASGLVPDGARLIPSSDAQRTIVPRAGQRAVSAADIAKVDPSLKHLIHDESQERV